MIFCVVNLFACFLPCDGGEPTAPLVNTTTANNTCCVARHCNVLKDIALPLMRDPRWEPDTLFMVFEEDFRFTGEADSEPEVIKASKLQEVVGETDEPEERERVPLDDSNKAAWLYFDLSYLFS